MLKKEKCLKVSVCVIISIFKKWKYMKEKRLNISGLLCQQSQNYYCNFRANITREKLIRNNHS